MTDKVSFTDLFPPTPARKVIVSVRTLRSAIENALLSYTRSELEVILANELELALTHEESSPDEEPTKRDLMGREPSRPGRSIGPRRPLIKSVSLMDRIVCAA